MKDIITKIKSLDSLSKLPTKRLLAYYKVRRKDKKILLDSCTCHCCGSTLWELKPNNPHTLKLKKEYDTLEKHVKEVKQMLDQRENVRN
jgi:hypothetical protein